MLQHIQLIILDLDYVVFDCAKLKLQSLRQSLISLADIIPPDVRLPDEVDVGEAFQQHGLQWLDNLELGFDEENLDALRQSYVLNESRLVAAGVGSVFPGLRSFIQEYREKGIAVALGAEATRDYLVAVSERHQLEEMFQISLCTEEYGSGGSEEMLEEIIHFTEVNPSEALVLGARPRLFEAAHNLEMLAIECGWGVRQPSGDADIQAPIIAQLNSAIVKADQLASEKY